MEKRYILSKAEIDAIRIALRTAENDTKIAYAQAETEMESADLKDSLQVIRAALKIVYS